MNVTEQVIGIAGAFGATIVYPIDLGEYAYPFRQVQLNVLKCGSSVKVCGISIFCHDDFFDLESCLLDPVRFIDPRASLSIDNSLILACRTNGAQLLVKCCTRIAWTVHRRSFAMKDSSVSTAVLALN